MFVIMAIFVNAAIAQLPSYVPASGLILYYSFNGNANDLSGHGITGTVVGASYGADRFGTANAALHFTGTGESVTTHKIDRTTVNTFSYSVWVNPDTSASIPSQGSSSGLTTYESLTCVIAPADGWNWSTGMTDVGVGLNVANNGIYVIEHGQSITNVSLSWSGTLTGWHHVVLEYVSKQPQLYIDGAFVQNGLTSSYTVHPSVACDSYVTGSSYPYLTAGFGHGLYPIYVPPYNYMGGIDDMAIYNRALTPCEITELYDTTATTITISGTSSLCPGQTTTLTSSVTGGSWSSSNTGVATVGSSTGIVLGTGSGVANISYTMGTGCYGIMAVSVNSLPNISGATSVCIGSSVTLSIALTGGTWSSSPEVSIGSSTGIMTGLSPGLAHVAYTLPTGCFSSTIISVNPVPPTPYGAAQVCVGAYNSGARYQCGGSIYCFRNGGITTGR